MLGGGPERDSHCGLRIHTVIDLWELDDENRS
jgi:hypothetical protein